MVSITEKLMYSYILTAWKCTSQALVTSHFTVSMTVQKEKAAVASYFASHAFSTAVPSVWNSLESDLRSAALVTSLKYYLKTALFSAACNT